MAITSIGKFKDIRGGIVNAFRIVNAPAYGEATDEIATISNSLDVGAHGSGEAGLWSKEDFSRRYTPLK